jgi:hemerythrin-like metal-binding protein
MNHPAQELINTVNRFQTIVHWNDHMSVKVTRFDEDHKAWIGMIDRLSCAMEKGEESRVIGGILSQSADYCAGHFKREEQLMEQYHYPGYREHKQIHDQFCGKLAEISGEFSRGKVAPSTIVCLQSDWLMNHILNEDKQYAEFFRGKGVK